MVAFHAFHGRTNLAAALTAKPNPTSVGSGHSRPRSTESQPPTRSGTASG